MNSAGQNGSTKWIVAILTAILLAGSSGITYAIRTWNVVDDVKLIRDRQDDVRIRLTVVERQLSENAQTIAELRDELRAHAASEQGGTR